jgi:hypothetical protein
MERQTHPEIQEEHQTQVCLFHDLDRDLLTPIVYSNAESEELTYS